MNPSQAWLEFGGVKSTTLGVIMREEPVISSPVMRVDSNTAIPGRSGKVIITDGCFEPVTITFKLACLATANMHDIRAWLAGTGDLVIGDDPTHVWKDAAIVKEHKYTYKARTTSAEFDVTFQCDPFRRLKTENSITVRYSRNAQSFSGQGDVPSYPLLRVDGNGDAAALTINGIVLKVNIRSGVPLYIDCDAKLAYTYDSTDSMVYAGTSVVLDSGAWPELVPTTNSITMANSITSVTIAPKWRFF